MLNNKRIGLGMLLVTLATLLAPTVLDTHPSASTAPHIVIADGTAPPPPPIPYKASLLRA